MASKYDWQYCSLGGSVRVRIGSGEDIAHLGELDQKMWTVLSCPVADLEFDKQTLEFLDTEKDGRLMVKEVVQAAEWLTSVIKDKDSILNGDSVLSLSQINTDNEVGKKLYDSAKQILKNIGADKNEISVADASDNKAIFAGTKFNGDGIITEVTAGDDDNIKKIITDCIATVGGSTDRGGDPGVNAEQIEKFYAACTAYSDWQNNATANRVSVFPYGDNTEAAYNVVNELKDKVSDFFVRCRLVSYDKATADSVAVAVTNIGDIASCPLALPSATGVLPLHGINPGWQAAFDKLRTLVLAVEFPGKEGITESDWNAVLAKLAPYAAWLGAKAGAEVESLGYDRVSAILMQNKKQELLDLVAKDEALRGEAESIIEVKKLVLYYRDFFKLLKNFVLFTDFYGREQGSRAIFELGQLYIDQRCCDLCIKVSDMSKHADMASLSGIFLIYCKCTNVVLGQSMDIVAVMTDGDLDNLRPGKNGIFYDLQGRNWDATITKIVDNPISIKEAFWSPYRKAWEFCVNLINKSAADKESKITSSLQSSVQSAADSTAAATTGTAEAPSGKQQAFDIAKFAGIFAAIGMAMGYIGSFFTSLATGVANTPAYKLLLALLAIIIIISGPSCFIAWMKLRKRNLGPVLNANGWAINAKVGINILFGGKLTSLAHYPKVNLTDPYGRKKPKWKVWLPIIIILALAAAGAYLYFFNYLDFVGLHSPLHRFDPAVVTDSTAVHDAVKAVADSVKTVAETTAEAAAEVADAAAETVTE